MQAINAYAPDVHINLQYKKWKIIEDNQDHQTQIYIKKIKNY